MFLFAETLELGLATMSSLEELSDLFLRLSVHYEVVQLLIIILLTRVLTPYEVKHLGLDASFGVIPNHLNRNPAAI